MGALVLHGSGKTNVKPARAALDAKWQRLADPDLTLAPDVRAKRAAMLERAHMIALSLAAAEGRRRRKSIAGRLGTASGRDALGATTKLVADEP